MIGLTKTMHKRSNFRGKLEMILVKFAPYKAQGLWHKIIAIIRL